MGNQAVKWEICPVGLGGFPVTARWGGQGLRLSGCYSVRGRKVCAAAAALQSGQVGARRNSFAGLVRFSRRFSESRPSLSGCYSVLGRKVCAGAAALQSGPGGARRNSFAGLVRFSRRFSESRHLLRTKGGGKTNDAWLSQTVDAPRPDRTARLGSELFGKDGKARIGAWEKERTEEAEEKRGSPPARG
jgi:hypothetical protein